jgi:hypothetical protein
MLFAVSVLEPYLNENGDVVWRTSIPCVVKADDEARAVESLREHFWVRVPEVARKLEEHPNWKKGTYREVTVAEIPASLSGVIPVFSHIAGSRAKRYYI